MAVDKEQVDALRQMVGAALQQMGRDLEGFHKKAQEASSSTGGFKKLDAIFGSMSKSLLGPIGLAAGFYAVARELEKVAVNSVQMQNFARNTGFASENVQDMQQAMRRMGMSMQEANSVIGTLGSKLNNLAAFKEGSELYRTLSQSQGGVQFANRLKELVQAGNQMGAVNEIIRTFSVQTREAKIALSEYFGVPVSVLEDYSRASARGIEIWQVNAKEAQKYHDMWVDFEVQFSNIWKNIANHGIEGINKLGIALSEEGITARRIADEINSGTDTVLATLKTDIQDIKDIIAAYKALRDSLKPENIVGGAQQQYGPPNPVAPPISGPNGPGPQPDPTITTTGKWQTFKSWWLNVLPNATGAFPPNDGSATFNERFGAGDFSNRSIILQTDSNAVLRDMRDILQRMELKGEGSGSGGGGGFGTYGTGIRGGAAQAGLGGFRPYGTRNPPNADPRGLADYIRETAKKYNIDPETAVRVAQSEGLRDFYGDNNTSFGAFQAHIGGGLGDEYRKETGRDPADPSNERDLIDWQLRKASKEGWGPYHGAPRVGVTPFMGIGGRPGYAGSPARGASMEGVDARLVELAKAAEQYLPKGYTIRPTSGLRTGDAGFHGVGQASDWQIYDPDGKPIPNRGPDKTGLYEQWARGAYTEMLKRYPYLKGKLAWGGSFETSRGSGQQDLMHLDFGKERGGMYPYLSDLGPVSTARDRIDATQSQASGTNWGNINASVEFLNVPNGVKTNAETDGPIFKQLQISKTKQAGVYRQPFVGYE